MKIPQNKWQAPFTKETLMDRLRFSDFCKKQGVNVSMSELKWLHENKIIFPVIRVFTGCIAVRKLKENDRKHYYVDDIEKNSDLEKLVQKEVYYKTGLVVKSGKDWLNWYEKRKMYSFPSQEKTYIPITQTNGVFSSMNEVPEDSEVFYDEYQFIALKLVLHELRISNRFSSTEAKKKWHDSARKKVAEFNKFFRFYLHIKTLKQDLEKDSNETFQVFMKEYDNHRPNSEKDLKNYKKNRQKEKFQKKAHQLIKKSKYDTKDVERWLKIISAKSFLRDVSYPFEFIKRYIQMIPEEVLREEYINKFSEEILWYWNLLRKKEISFKDYLYSSFDRASCYVCGTVIPTGRKTCAKKECENEYNRLSRQAKRKVKPRYGQ